MFSPRLTYGALDHPFTASAIIGAGMGITTYLGCYFMRTDPQNSALAAIWASVAVGTVVSIPLVITRQWILLKTLPWADKPYRVEAKPIRAVFNPSSLPNLGRYELAVKMAPSMWAGWGVRDPEKIPAVINVLMTPPYRATEEVLAPVGMNRDDVGAIKKYLLDNHLGYEYKRTVELLLAGKARLRELQRLTH